MTEKRIIGIDYGERRIGIAITDPLMIFVYPLETLYNDSNFWQNFVKLLSNYEIDKFVLGYPLRQDGSKWQVTEKIELFAEELKKRLNKEVIFADERYTSELAKGRILESVSKRSKRKDKGLLDKNAAAIILEDYLRETNIIK